MIVSSNVELSSHHRMNLTPIISLNWNCGHIFKLFNYDKLNFTHVSYIKWIQYKFQGTVCMMHLVGMHDASRR